jgi:membrane protein implicated in regulation of membrane protease activity
MDAWVIWLLAAVALAAGEIMTLGFFLAPFSIGAGAAMLTALAGGAGAVQLIVFLVVSGATFGLVRPVARRHMTTPAQIRTGTAALIGRPAMVLERIANHEGVGCVKIDGEVWTARAYMDDDIIEAGARVQVMEIRGATALVSE